MAEQGVFHSVQHQSGSSGCGQVLRHAPAGRSAWRGCAALGVEPDPTRRPHFIASFPNCHSAKFDIIQMRAKYLSSPWRRRRSTLSGLPTCPSVSFCCPPANCSPADDRQGNASQHVNFRARQSHSTSEVMASRHPSQTTMSCFNLHARIRHVVSSSSGVASPTMRLRSSLERSVVKARGPLVLSFSLLIPTSPMLSSASGRPRVGSTFAGRTPSMSSSIRTPKQAMSSRRAATSPSLSFVKGPSSKYTV